MKMLVSGFKPFLGQAINPSEILAVQLSEKFSEVQSVILPVEFENSFLILKGRIEKEKPDFLIMLGQASGRKKISLEKIALNWNQTMDSDEAGMRPQSGSIIENSELALMTSFPVDDTFQKLKAHSSFLEISFSAGTYVCNELYYRVLKNRDPLQLKSVFIHLPLIPEQVPINDKPSLKIEKQFEILADLIHSLR